MNIFTISALAGLVWLLISFIVVIDIFKQKTALGCLGLLLLPIVPLFWVLTGYSGSKKIMAPLLYGSAALAIIGMGTAWTNASSSLKSFIQAAEKEELNLSFVGIKSFNGEMQYVVKHRGIYKPNGNFTSVEQMVSLIQKEKVNTLAAYYPKEFTREIIVLAIPTESGFVVTYEIDGVDSIRDRYPSSPNAF